MREPRACGQQQRGRGAGEELSRLPRGCLSPPGGAAGQRREACAQGRVPTAKMTLPRPQSRLASQMEERPWPPPILGALILRKPESQGLWGRNLFQPHKPLRASPGSFPSCSSPLLAPSTPLFRVCLLCAREPGPIPLLSGTVPLCVCLPLTCLSLPCPLISPPLSHHVSLSCSLPPGFCFSACLFFCLTLSLYFIFPLSPCLSSSVCLSVSLSYLYICLSVCLPLRLGPLARPRLALKKIACPQTQPLCPATQRLTFWFRLLTPAAASRPPLGLGIERRRETHYLLPRAAASIC